MCSDEDDTAELLKELQVCCLLVSVSVWCVIAVL